MALFPGMPGRSTVSLKTGDEERAIGNFYRRIYGYLHTDVERSYDFKLFSRDGAEAIIFDTGVFVDEVNMMTQLEYYPTNEVVSLKLTKPLIDYQDELILLNEMFSTEVRNIRLKKNKIYFLEIVQGGKFFIKYDLQWRENGKQTYTTITEKNVFHTKNMSGLDAVSLLKQKYKTQPRFGVTDSEKVKLSFHKIPVLDSEKMIETSPKYSCEAKKDYKNITSMYQGYKEFTENVFLYPNGFFAFDFNSTKVVLDIDEAEGVIKKTFHHLSELHNK